MSDQLQPEANRARLQALLDCLIDDPLDTRARVELEKLLIADPELRRDYVAQVIVHNSLEWNSQLNGAGTDVEDEQHAAADCGPFAKDLLASSWRRRSVVRRWLIAATILLAASAAFFSFWPESPEIATVSQVNEIVCTAEQEPLLLGKRLSKGQVSIESGELGLVFSSGATVRLHGRTCIQIESPTLVRLVHGKVTSSVSHEAIGFTVLTPSLDVIDLGTEFGVGVDEHGGTDVVVFSGEVRLERNSAEFPAIGKLRQGEGISVASNDDVRRIGQIMRDTGSGGWVAGPLAESDTSIRVIQSVTDNLRISDNANFYEVVHGGFGEDSRAYVDRTHEWNGIDLTGLPQELLGADYVRTFNSDKIEDAIQIKVTVSRPCTLYLLWDSRCQPQPWLLENFTKTDMEVGLDEGPRPEFVLPLGRGPGQSVDRRHTVWVMNVERPTTVTLGPIASPELGQNRSMYGIVAKRLARR